MIIQFFYFNSLNFYFLDLLKKEINNFDHIIKKKNFFLKKIIIIIMNFNNKTPN